MLKAGEVVLEGPRVDLERAVTGAQDDPSDRALALAGRLNVGLGGNFDGLARHRLVGDLIRGDGVRLGALLGLGLGAGALLRGHLALGLDGDRLQLRAGRGVLRLRLLGSGRLCLGGLLSGRLCLGGLLSGRLGLGSLLGGCLSLRCVLGGCILGGRLVLGSALLGCVLGGCLSLRLRGLGLRGLGFGGLVVLSLVVGHQASISIGLGCWAACGCSGPA
jgi:hypothetical protein